MRPFVIVLGLVISVHASAAPTPEAVIRGELEVTCCGEDVSMGTYVEETEKVITSDPVMVTVRGERGAGFADMFIGPWTHDLRPMTKKLGALTVVVDETRGFAWFYGTVDITFDGNRPKDQQAHEVMRVSGIALAAEGWKLASTMYASPLPDSTLISSAKTRKTPPASGEPALTGDPALGKAVAGWFKTGLAAARSTHPKIAAGGTAPTETGAGAAAVKLARTWDKLKLGATDIDARLFASGEVGWITAKVRMPVKKTTVAAEMVLGGIVVKEAGGYRWVSLSFTPTSAPE